LKETFSRRSVAEWIETLTKAGLPCAPVNDIEAALSDEQTAARRSVREYTHSSLGNVRYVSSPFGAEFTRQPSRAPFLDERKPEATG